MEHSNIIQLFGKNQCTLVDVKIVSNRQRAYLCINFVYRKRHSDRTHGIWYRQPLRQPRTEVPNTIAKFSQDRVWNG